MTSSHMLLAFVYTPHIAVQQQHVHTVKQTLTQSVWFHLGVCVIKTVKCEVWSTVCIDCAKSVFFFICILIFSPFSCTDSDYRVNSKSTHTPATLKTFLSAKPRKHMTKLVELTRLRWLVCAGGSAFGVKLTTTAKNWF